MFFFIGGIQPKTVLLEQQTRSCPSCGNFNVQLKRVDHYLAVFFIPIFRVKKGLPFYFCKNCNIVLNGEEREMPYEKIEKKQCRFCKDHFNPDYPFCPYCGKPAR